MRPPSASNNNSPQFPPSPSPNTQRNQQSLLTAKTTQLGSGTAEPQTPSRPGTTLPQQINTDESPSGQPQTTQKIQRSLKDRVAAAEERGETKPASGPDSWDPLEKYTQGEMPKVHHSHPMALLSDIDINLIGEWEELPDEKLLAQPFGDYAAERKNHGTLRALLFGAVIEITKAHKVTVCAPQQSPTSNKPPKTFLIYNLSEAQKQILLQRKVWSSTNISFHVAPLEPTCPDYLFTIKGLTTLTMEQLEKTIEEVWHDEATFTFLKTICEQVPVETQKQAEQTLLAFIDSMRVTQLDTKNKGDIPAPSFCVYASGNIINEESTWCRLRNYLASREYKIKFQDPGIVYIPHRPCSLCHGADHPRGLCPFPQKKGWNGPTGKIDSPLIDLERRSDTTSFRDRNRAKAARIF